MAGLKSRKMGTKFIGRGILTVIPVIIIIVFIVFLMGMTSPFIEDAPPEVSEIIDEISSSPVLGETSKSFGDYGQTNLGWGLGIGAFLFIIAMILFIVAGVLEIMARCDFCEVPELEEEVKEEGEAEAERC